MENIERNTVHTITLEDIANSFGATVDDIKKSCIDIIDNIDLNYSIISGEERDRTILNILKKIDNDKQIIGSPERQLFWNNSYDKSWSVCDKSHLPVNSLALVDSQLYFNLFPCQKTC